jgi:hypothetical protein
MHVMDYNGWQRPAVQGSVEVLGACFGGEGAEKCSYVVTEARSCLSRPVTSMK